MESSTKNSTVQQVCAIEVYSEDVDYICDTAEILNKKGIRYRLTSRDLDSDSVTIILDSTAELSMDDFGAMGKMELIGFFIDQP